MTLLSIDKEGQLALTIQHFVGKSVALLGITSSGKTNTGAVLIEELLGQGLPLTIVDIEGEYWGLKERYDLLVVGRSEHAELPISVENAAALAEASLSRGISVILDLSEYSQAESYELLVAYFTRLWEIAGKLKLPYQIVLEEAHEWIPQGVSTPLKGLLTRIALRGRKRGLGIILISQRSAKVEKDVLTQVSLLFLHKVVHPIDVKVYKELLPLSGAQVEEMIGHLQVGEALVLHNHQVQGISIRLRHTFHAGVTPTFGEGIQPELRQIDTTLLEELQNLLVSPLKEREQGGKEQKLAKRIQELEAELLVCRQEIAQLKEQNALLSKLTVSVSSPDTLSIKQAMVGKMIAQSGAFPTSTVVESSLAKQQQVATILPAPDAPPLNESKFRSLKRRLEQIDSLCYRILLLLIEQGKALSIRDIAAWLNLSESHVRHAPLSTLLQMKLITREKYGKEGYFYTSYMREYLQREFPGANGETLIRRLFEE